MFFLLSTKKWVMFSFTNNHDLNIDLDCDFVSRSLNTRAHMVFTSSQSTFTIVGIMLKQLPFLSLSRFICERLLKFTLICAVYSVCRNDHLSFTETDIVRDV